MAAFTEHSMYKRMLVPVDGSPASMLGLQHAVGLAKPLGARIRLLNVVDELALVPAVDAYALVDFTAMIAALKEGGQKVLDEAAAVAARNGVEAEKVQLESLGGHVSSVIVEDAKQWRADVICMGTHGRRGLNRLLLGSDAERVLREAVQPVLLVRAEETKQDAEKASRRRAA
jgi:nucleotide-binding universal stress UspA family protein